MSVAAPRQRYFFRLEVIDNVDNRAAVEAGPVEIQAVRKYSPFNGRRVAMRQGDEVRMRTFMETTWAPPP